MSQNKNVLSNLIEPAPKTKVEQQESRDLRAVLEKEIWFQTYQTSLVQALSAYNPLQLKSHPQRLRAALQAAMFIADVAHEEYIKHVNDNTENLRKFGSTVPSLEPAGSPE